MKAGARDGLSQLASVATACRGADEFRAEAIAWIDRNIGIDVASMVQIDGHGRARVTRTMNIGDGWVDRFHRTIASYRADVRSIMDKALAMGGALSGEVTRLEGWAGLPGRDGFEEDMVFPLGVRIGTAAVIRFRGVENAILFLGRAGGRRTFSTEESGLLASAAPVLALGVALHERTAQVLPEVPAPRRAPRGTLTSRERSVVEYAVLGLSNREIGLALGTSANTVRNQLASIFAKLSVASRVEMVAIALTEGLVDVPRSMAKPE